jgi:hypothetical protein
VAADLVNAGVVETRTRERVDRLAMEVRVGAADFLGNVVC